MAIDKLIDNLLAATGPEEVQNAVTAIYLSGGTQHVDATMNNATGKVVEYDIIDNAPPDEELDDEEDEDFDDEEEITFVSPEMGETAEDTPADNLNILIGSEGRVSITHVVTGDQITVDQEDLERLQVKLAWALDGLDALKTRTPF